MGLRRKPHTVTAYRTEEDLDGAVIVGHVDGVGVQVHGMMVPTSSTDLYDRYGVEVKRAWILMADPEAEAHLVEGGRVVWEDRRFAIAGGPLCFKGFGNADNVSAPLDEIVLAT